MKDIDFKVVANKPDGTNVLCKVLKIFFDTNEINIEFPDGNCEYYELQNTIFLQYTGLKDKNGLTKLYECDIINKNGLKIGNFYENKNLLKNKTNFIIKNMSTKEWRSSEQEIIKRGCQYAESTTQFFKFG